MLSSRKFLRREFFCIFPSKIFAAVNQLDFRSELPKLKFEIGDRVVRKRICDDHLSPNYGDWDWECEFVIGYCWNYDKWLNKRFNCGWTYFVGFDSTNYSKNVSSPWIDFEHETKLAIA